MIPDYPRIYLQPHEAGIGRHTWCQDRIGDNDIEYIRSDIADELAWERESHWRPQLEAAQAANTALTAKVELLASALRPFGKLGGIPEHFDDAVKVQAGIDYTMDAEEFESLQKLSGGALTSATLIVIIDGLTVADLRTARAALDPKP